MQTFLPVPDFGASAKILDNKRLISQRKEAYQILLALSHKRDGWRRHPATIMWHGHMHALSEYGLVMCEEVYARGFEDTVYKKIRGMQWGLRKSGMPYWLGDEAFHSAHRASLLAKLPTYYSKFGWTETPAINYVWPADPALVGLSCVR